MSDKTEERTSKYWICDECAKEKKWKQPTWPVTCISGLCGYCEREDKTTLTPTCDFSTPERKAVWD